MNEQSIPGRSEWLARALVRVSIVGHVLVHEILPAGLVWAIGSAEALDVFSGFDTPALRRVAGLGLFLSAVAAIITTESLTRLARPFRVGHFLIAVSAIGVFLFPSLAEGQRIHLGLTAEQFIVLQSYCYLALRVIVGILIGATVSWVLLAGYSPLPVPRYQPSRK